MRYALLKAQARKQKYLTQINKFTYESDDTLSSDNEDELSEKIVGDILNNRYICLKYLGKGTFSTVWLVYDICEDEFKVAKHHTENNFEESKNEIKVLNTLNKDMNDHIIRFYEYFYYEKYGNKYGVIILELLGISLLDIINDYNTLNLNELCIKRILSNILKGFKTIHEHGFIHADLKPENILLTLLPSKIEYIIEEIRKLNPQLILQTTIEKYTPDNLYSVDKNKRKFIKRKLKLKSYNYLRNCIILKVNECNDHFCETHLYNTEAFINGDFKCKVIDFGNAEHIDSISQSELYLRIYRPPENIMSNNYTTKADIWVIGCIFYEIITGTSLFEINRNLNNNQKNRDHLYQMFNVFGSINQNSIDSCDFYDEFFNYKGKLEMKHIEKRSILPLSQTLNENSIISDTNFNNKLYELLNIMFEYNTNMRPDAYTLLNLPIFNE